MQRFSRRDLLAATAAGTVLVHCDNQPKTSQDTVASGPGVIDFHQHTNYLDRSDDDLVAHQRKMGVDLTVLLPAGSRLGLDARAGRNQSVVSLAERFPAEFICFANELPDVPETRAVLEKYLESGAKGIGEGPIVAIAPAIANAVFQATGVRIKELPLTPERVWRALKEARAG